MYNKRDILKSNNNFSWAKERHLVEWIKHKILRKMYILTIYEAKKSVTVKYVNACEAILGVK